MTIDWVEFMAAQMMRYETPRELLAAYQWRVERMRERVKRERT